ISLERGVVKLDPGIVQSDAQQFLELIHLARMTPGHGAIAHLEQARALYTADLFDGPDPRRFAWLVERDDSGVTLREHFRKLYLQAIMSLADLYATALNTRLEEAVDLYREAVELDPGDDRL